MILGVELAIIPPLSKFVRTSVSARIAETMRPEERTVVPDKACILVVDDEPAIRTIMREALIRADYRVEVAVDGTDALEGVRRRDFDAIVLDLRMPGKNGLEVLKTVRSLRPEIPVIIASGGATPADLSAARAEGAFACLAKPFRLNQIVREVGRAVKSRAARRVEHPIMG